MEIVSLLLLIVRLLVFLRIPQNLYQWLLSKVRTAFLVDKPVFAAVCCRKRGSHLVGDILQAIVQPGIPHFPRLEIEVQGNGFSRNLVNRRKNRDILCQALGQLLGMMAGLVVPGLGIVPAEIGVGVRVRSLKHGQALLALLRQPHGDGSFSAPAINEGNGPLHQPTAFSTPAIMRPAATS